MKKLFEKQPDNSIAIEVPDGYLVAETNGCLGEYPGIRVGFWTEDGFLADIAVVESEDARDATGEPSDKYEVHLWDFGEECCHDLTDLEFTSGDVTRHVSRLEALSTEYGTAPCNEDIAEPAKGLAGLTDNQLRDLLKAYDMYVAAAFNAGLPETGWCPVCVGEFYENEYQSVWLAGETFDYMGESEQTGISEETELYFFDFDHFTCAGIWNSSSELGWHWERYGVGNDGGWKEIDGGLWTVKVDDDGNIVEGYKTIQEAYADIASDGDKPCRESLFEAVRSLASSQLAWQRAQKESRERFKAAAADQERFLAELGEFLTD